MRLTAEQIEAIQKLAVQVAGDAVCTPVFGSRLDDAARGSDLDLMIEPNDPVTNPALLAAQLSAKISRTLHGRKVDVLIRSCCDPGPQTGRVLRLGLLHAGFSIAGHHPCRSPTCRAITTCRSAEAPVITLPPIAR
jgi:predicted nucleotidyltransferase